MYLEIFKSLTDESRLRIINLLLQRETCVCDIEAILDMSQSNVSRHLNKLRLAGLVTFRKHAQWTHYRISETFSENNPHLISHLKQIFNAQAIFNEDLQMLANHADPDRCAEK